MSSEDEEFARNNLKMGVMSKLNNETYFTKVGIDSISSAAVLYLLYKVAENNNKYEYSVNDLYNNDDCISPKTVFNMSLDAFCSAIRNLDNDGFLRAELVAGLDNIHLNDKMTSKGALKLWWEKHK